MLDGLTHFAPSDANPNAFIAFKYDRCPKCGNKIYNSAEASPNIRNPKRDLLCLGLRFVNSLPADLTVDFHDDDGGDEEWGCESCF